MRKESEFENTKILMTSSELCFCLLTANFKADKSIEMQISYLRILYSNEMNLAIKLKKLGHRLGTKS